MHRISSFLMTLMILGFPTLERAQNAVTDSVQTGLIIQCPQEDIPVYVDGTLVGHTPLPDVILVNPGEHRIGFFPTVENSTDSVFAATNGLPGMKIVQVDRGYVVPVKLDYRTMVRDADLSRPLPEGGRWIGILVVFIMLGVTFWGMG